MLSLDIFYVFLCFNLSEFYLKNRRNTLQYQSVPTNKDCRRAIGELKLDSKTRLLRIFPLFESKSVNSLILIMEIDEL